jgi:hypothetical protein
MHDLNDLQFFAAVVGHRSFSAAARALGVPKSRVSRRVALLESRLSIPIEYLVKDYKLKGAATGRAKHR